MACKKWLLLAGIFILGSCFAFAASPGDSDENPNYYIDRRGSELRFIQRLIWEEAGYVTRYQVIVERLEEDGIYTEAERSSVTENHAEFSLAAGEYRYKVEVYDLLDELSFTTEWREFSIIPALQPVLTDFNPQAFFLDEEYAWELVLYGQNLLQESEYVLLRNDIRIVPQSQICEGNTARLFFPPLSIDPGDYSIYVRNPGGLDVLAEVFSVKYRRPVDLLISAGYSPIFPLGGYLFKASDLDAPFPDSVYPLGGLVKIDFLVLKFAWGYLGIEASGSLSSLEHSGDLYTTKALLQNINFGLLYQKYFYRKTFAFNVHFGAGMATLRDFYFEYQDGSATDKTTDSYFSANAGLSFMYFFIKPLYIGLGMDYIRIFTPPDDGKTPDFLRPYVSVGIIL